MKLPVKQNNQKIFVVSTVIVLVMCASALAIYFALSRLNVIAQTVPSYSPTT